MLPNEVRSLDPAAENAHASALVQSIETAMGGLAIPPQDDDDRAGLIARGAMRRVLWRCAQDAPDDGMSRRLQALLLALTYEIGQSLGVLCQPRDLTEEVERFSRVLGVAALARASDATAAPGGEGVH